MPTRVVLPPAAAAALLAAAPAHGSSQLIRHGVGIGLGVGSLAPEDSSATPASTS